MTQQGLLLDTHVWLHYLGAPRLLRALASKAIDAAVQNRSAFVSVISIWELAMLERDGRIELTGGIDRWTHQALLKPGIALLPFSPDIAIEAVRLPPPMHNNPADRILVASARIERLSLVTADRAIWTFARTTGLALIRA